jgi:hypothetical protein
MWSTVRPIRRELDGELAELARLEFPNEDPNYLRAAVTAAREGARTGEKWRPWQRWWRRRRQPDRVGQGGSCPA